MASDILHIKDSYYFEVPKALWRVNHKSSGDFPEVWIRLDPQYQKWEAKQMIRVLREDLGLGDSVPAEDKLIHDWQHWSHSAGNHGKPFDAYLEAQYKVARQSAEREKLPFNSYTKMYESEDGVWFATNYADEVWRSKWERVKDSVEDFNEYVVSPEGHWSGDKIESYNKHLSGKILIPQPFGKLRNLYQPEDGQFCVSKFMVIEVAVALICCLVFGWLAKRVSSGGAPRGIRWNLLETFVLFIRNEVARPAIGSHDGDRFVPLLLTMFFFVLGCNLMGMIPWVGGPTGSFSVTLAMAAVTLGTVVICGMQRFGFLGFFKNQIPSMDLPMAISIIIKPMLFVIEMLGLFIKHGVLAIRLLANMVAGHIVLLAIMGIAFSAKGAASDYWSVAAVISVLGSTAISCLELFVAFFAGLHFYVFVGSVYRGCDTPPLMTGERPQVVFTRGEL